MGDVIDLCDYRKAKETKGVQLEMDVLDRVLADPSEPPFCLETGCLPIPVMALYCRLRASSSPSKVRCEGVSNCPKESQACITLTQAR